MYRASRAYQAHDSTASSESSLGIQQAHVVSMNYIMNEFKLTVKTKRNYEIEHKLPSVTLLFSGVE